MELMWNIISNPFKQFKSENLKKDCSSENYALITSPRDVLEFDRDRSTALCIGINKRFHPHYIDTNTKSFEKTIARSAGAMSKAFVTNLGLNGDRVEIRVSSTQRDDCTKQGIATLFVESAKTAREGGIFIFYFAGHGVLVGDRCVLAPADFAGSADLTTGISGDDLVKWLQIAECKADHVLVILDCCYAGDLGTTLTSPDIMLKIKPSLFVMCGCAAREKCMSVDALEHTIFTYFFLRYLEKHQGKMQHQFKRQFAVKQAMDDITKLCFCFSSLFISFDNNKGEFQRRQMNPILDRLDYQEVEVDSIDEPDSSRLDLIIQFIEKDQPKPAPHSEVFKWLKSPMTQNAIFTLYSGDTFPETLHNGIFSALLYSAAHIQHLHDKTHLESRNLFLMTAINVLGTIGFAYPMVNADISLLITGLRHYIYSVLSSGMNVTFLSKLLSNMVKTMTQPDKAVSELPSSYDARDGCDEVDGPAAPDIIPDKEMLELCRLPFWEPLSLI